jgi:hypothetical protein
MYVRDIITAYSETRSTQTNTLCGKYSELLKVKVGGIYSNHSALKLELGYMLQGIFLTT